MRITPPKYSLRDLILYFLKLGATGFGGPVALVSYMHRDLVEKRQWISEDDYKEGLALAQLTPGPLAAQLAIYIGYVHYRIIGATLAGICFILPSFLIVLILGWVYVVYGGLRWIHAVFYGVSAGVLGIIAVSSYKLTKKTIGDRGQWIIFATFVCITFWFGKENIVLLLSAGILYCLYKTKFSIGPKTLIFTPFFFSIPPTIFLSTQLEQIAVVFMKAGAFVFGGGLAILPFLYGDVVKEFHWLTEQQFLDAVAVSMITPGPILITVGFMGYLIAGFPGACVAAFATFLPCYVCTIIPAPYLKKYAKNQIIKAFVEGLTAAAIGALVGAVMIIAYRQLTDLPTIAIGTLSALILLYFKRMREPILIGICALLGYILKTYGDI